MKDAARAARRPRNRPSCTRVLTTARKYRHMELHKQTLLRADVVPRPPRTTRRRRLPRLLAAVVAPPLNTLLRRLAAPQHGRDLAEGLGQGRPEERHAHLRRHRQRLLQIHDVSGCRLQSVWGRWTQPLPVNAAPGLSVELCVPQRLASGQERVTMCFLCVAPCHHENFCVLSSVLPLVRK